MRPFMRPLGRLFTGGLLGLLATSAGAAVLQASTLQAPALQASALQGVHLFDGADSTRIVLDLGAAPSYKLFTLANPDRLVVDLTGVTRAPGLKDQFAAKGIVRGLRSGPRDGGLRLVIDLSAPVDPHGFVMAPGDGYGNRLIVDLNPKTAAPLPTAAASSQAMPPAAAPETVASVPPQRSAATAPAQPSPSAAQALAAADTDSPPPASRPQPRMQEVNAPPIQSSIPPQMRAKPIVVAVDAGHGGIDPGAHGPHGVQEKDVTLAIARKLAAMINAQPGMRAVLTRDGDYYVDLRERTVKARDAEADLFVSIHCNALTNKAMRGTAVYVLSDHGASSEQARWVANHENAADLVGGVNLQDKGDQLAAVLIDISQTATMEASFDLGNRMLDSLGRINVLQKAQVQQAGFMVLKSPDIPSVLVETAYITNDREEHMLADPDYQGRIAASLLGGVRGYFSNYRPLQQLASATPVSNRSHHSGAKPIPVSLRRGSSDGSGQGAD